MKGFMKKLKRGFCTHKYMYTFVGEGMDMKGRYYCEWQMRCPLCGKKKYKRTYKGM